MSDVDQSPGGRKSSFEMRRERWQYQVAADRGENGKGAPGSAYVVAIVLTLRWNRNKDDTRAMMGSAARGGQRGGRDGRTSSG